MKTSRTSQVIKKSFDRLKRSNPKFSIRALASKIGLSHVYVMKILKSEASIPPEKIAPLIKALSLDELALSELKEAILSDAVEERLSAFPKTGEKKKANIENFEEYPLKFAGILEEWYYLPILDLLTCNISSKSIPSIAKNLGLMEHEVLTALEKIQEFGLATSEKGQWKKTNNRIRFPTTIPSDITKKYYKKVLKKAYEELNNSSSERFSKRSITNLSIAVDPDKVKEAKEKLHKCIYEIANEMASGDCKEVYFLTTCLFPLTPEK